MANDTTLVFLDTETLGLGIDDPIWEIAAIRREADGTEKRFHVHVTGRKGLRLIPPDGFPEQFRADFDARYERVAGVPTLRRRILRPSLRDLFRDRPHVVGAVPNFDTERIAPQFGVNGWPYHLNDNDSQAAMEALAAEGYREENQPVEGNLRAIGGSKIETQTQKEPEAALRELLGLLTERGGFEPP